MPLPFLPPFLPLPLLSRPWYIRAVAASEPLESKAGASGADLSQDSYGDERDGEDDDLFTKGSPPGRASMGIAVMISMEIAPERDRSEAYAAAAVVRCCSCRRGEPSRAYAVVGAPLVHTTGRSLLVPEELPQGPGVSAASVLPRNEGKGEEEGRHHDDGTMFFKRHGTMAVHAPSHLRCYSLGTRAHGFH